MPISRDEVRHVADLARLHLSETELDAMHSDLNRVLEYFRHLQELDLAGVELTPHSVDVYGIWRGDEIEEGLTRSDAIAGAPSTAAGLFLVPTIID
ncbi:Asp-tRNA(Asn)/Glu-tRNA(Gln) amidotransferase subunit GatC [Fimbriimonadia bacterium ATM]|nr:MAG: Asp-tRNA(Asn)/Glu-tRNA(Gln) amidotransferase subunit GatC [Armatimonadota bacterium]MBC6970170.1 Asp-tRNA(Asn)/Glu-tRNA(Gln) amidotransferase subunit GatC [Armatimonadota bacterium]MCE7900573.1 Asp-tRNA(Asn)/Glu-tRNA(Gln) amidotransferase subunit GatC [Armatimonadetes bacterium ATM1]MDL1929346.1 Asp-tRNA(Asn)/Glu-tRNA(Gln) amidotransferase subunit GatC [Fimbriimonadia bacterium ATM]RIJ97119.1 MAG: Asp-tRNA(Asn)/Glu-tRNA(Gln) amidotransferase subunit GatB [Armatimonadota bacterium]